MDRCEFPLRLSPRSARMERAKHRGARNALVTQVHLSFASPRPMMLDAMHVSKGAVVTWIVLPLLTLALGLAIAIRLHDGVAAPVTKYPALTRQHFMNSCITSGGTQSSCACAIDGIQAHYTLPEFAAFDARAKAGEKMPEDLVRIVATCNAAIPR